MGVDINTLSAAKNYVDETLVGAGALKGEDGFSPIIAENADNTDEVYKLNITTADKTFTTANLKGDKGADGADGLSPVISENVNNTEDSYKLDVTDKNGTFTTPNLKGKQGLQGLQGIKGEKGDTGEQGLQGIQGIKGDKGDDGYPFLIYKEYSSLDEFDAAHFPEIGLMFMIKTGENFPVYRYTGDTDTPYSYVTELATSEGIKGEKGDKGDTGEQGIQGEAGKDGADGTTYTPSIGTVENAEEAFATVEIDEETKQAVFNFGFPKGADGVDGEKAVQFVPVITDDNELAWENDGGLENPPTVPIQQIFSNAPIGTVLSFAGQAAPNGYLLCDGASYAVADYPELYAVIGNIYGGDSTNFNVPNLVDKFIQGSTTSGAEKEAGLPNIEGALVSLNAGTSNFKDTEFVNGAFSAKTKWNAINGSGTMDSYGEVSFDASLSNPIYGNSDTVQPPALTMVYIIKAKYDGVEIEANGITVDSVLSGTSTNPVQNKAIVEALADKANLSDIPTSLPADGGNADTVEGLHANEIASNPNLLNNWYFIGPINQRGQTEYTIGISDGTYTIDHWENTNVGSVTLNQGIVCSGGSYVAQKIESPAVNFLGHNLTLSILTEYGLKTVTGQVPKTLSGVYTILAEITHENGMSTRLSIWENGRLAVDAIRANGVEISPKLFAIKLERGTVQTLARQNAEGDWVLNDPPPDPATELMKCQRYYQIHTSGDINPVDLRPNMRITPTITQLSDGNYAYDAEIY